MRERFTARTPMRISVVGPPSLSAEQIRAYAEYKFFSRLVTLTRDITGVSATVTAPDGDGEAVCSVTVELGDAGRVRTRVSRAGPVPAVDAAADLVARAAVKRLAQFVCPAAVT
jgi:hypothetical protein